MQGAFEGLGSGLLLDACELEKLLEGEDRVDYTGEFSRGH